MMIMSITVMVIIITMIRKITTVIMSIFFHYEMAEIIIKVYDTRCSAEGRVSVLRREEF